MKILPPRSAASPRPLAPAVAVAALSVLVGGLLPQPPSATTEGAPDVRPLDDAARATTVGAAATPASAAPVEGAGVATVPQEGENLVPAEEAPAGVVLGEPVVDRPFTVAAAVWDTAADDAVERVEIRVRQDGAWGPWQVLDRPVLPEDAAPARTGTDPFVAFGADGAQLRVTTADGAAPAGLELSLIDPGTAATDETVASAHPAVTAEQAAETAGLPRGVKSSAVVGGAAPAEARTVATASDARAKILPDVITRAQWGADESWAESSPQFDQVRALTIHHTAGTNDYSRAQAVEQMRGIYAYYTRTLGWGDFPYHLITDRFGNIYEGRRGALDSNPLGTHAGGFNRGTMGISTMGNYDVVAPSEEVVDAMARATAYYLYRDGIDARGRVTLTSGGSTKYAAGTPVTVDTIFPHRATSATACPGQHLMARFDDLRDRAEAIATAAGQPPAPATPAPTPAPTTEPSTAGTYTVQPNDGWWTIARRTGVPAATLQELNGMTESTVLHPGMVLRTVADPTAPEPTPITTGTYTVQPNDGWWVIARRTGVSAAELQRLNGMTASTVLHPGMVLITAATAPTSPPAPAPAPAPAPGTYTVREGDGWWIIAYRTGVTMETLQRLNGMTATTVLHPGMVLRTGQTASAPAPSPATYVVQANDGWWLIAQRTGVSMERLQRLNGMTVSTMLHPGMVLRTA
ncbi:LysM peptidoglycan-binding domain-containing protein [Micrococcus luteus]|uniref:LysM peptidoglycan-binding domain-containing protein n=1 Tax=Micrococcus luteus TaxID=1270 RepID=UPI003EB97F41